MSTNKIHFHLFYLFCVSFFLMPALILNAELGPVFKAMNQPMQPFKIIGNIYYVGASDVTSYLITTPAGHILLDCGFVETVPIIQEHVKELGFTLSDIKILTISHAHTDHAGGMAQLKKLTGAKLIVCATEVDLLSRGGRNDIHFGNDYPFPPVKADQTIKDNDTITLGGVVLTAHLTPGHTPGNMSWTTKVSENGKEYNIVFAASVTAPGYKLVNNSACPNIQADFEKSFALLKSLPCDVFLAPHGSFFGLQEKFKRLEAKDTINPFIDQQGYKEAIQRAEKVYRDNLEKQKKQH